MYDCLYLLTNKGCLSKVVTTVQACALTLLMGCNARGDEAQVGCYTEPQRLRNNPVGDNNEWIFWCTSFAPLTDRRLHKYFQQQAVFLAKAVIYKQAMRDCLKEKCTDALVTDQGKKN